MKLTSLLFLLAFMQVSAGVYSQTVRLNEKNSGLEKIFTEIRKQTGYNFLYKNRLLKNTQPVTLVVNGAPLEKVLEEVFRNQPLTYSIIDKTIVVRKKEEAFQQKNTIEPVVRSVFEVPITTITPRAIEAEVLERAIEVRGTVSDENGGVLPGVSIVLKGTTRGTSTDPDGKFSIAVPDPAATLIFSFVGYLPQEVVVGNRTSVNITLKVDTKALEEVVVVGYGTQSKRNVTGSVVKVDMKRTENLPNTNVTQSLRGRVAGVQFTDNGRPGQNGSILIRGPRSLAGGNNPLIVLDGIFFNGNLADINPNDIESMEVLKDASSAAIYGSRAANGVILITSKKGTTEKPTIRVNAFAGLSDWSNKMELLSPDRYIQKTLDYRRQAGLTADPAQIKTYLQTSEVPNYTAGKTIDPWDVVSQQGKLSSFDLSLSGRTALTNYLLSASMTDEKGLIFNDNLKRLSVRANIENQVTKWLTVGLNTTFIRRDYSGREANPGTAYFSSPYGTVYYPDGEPTQFVVTEDVIAGNPLRDAVLTKNEEIYNNLFTNFYALVNVPFVEGLSYRLNYSPNYRWQHNYNFYRQDKHITSNTTTASKVNREDFDWVLENIVTYNRQISRDHAFDVTLLYGRNHFGFESTTANASQLSSEALGWNDLGLGGVLTNTSTAEAADGVSSMFRFNYRLKDKYLLTFTVRRDGSSVFAANNKYATFPSAALAWVVSDEPFLKKLPFVDMLKLRLSYGAVGNQAIGPYQSLSLSSTTRYVFGDGGTSSLGVFPSNMANANLKWETTYTANAALDFDLFRGRIGGTIEAYKMNTRDLLVKRALPKMTGYDFVLTNLGATSNTGFELSLNTVNLRKGKFEWSSNLAFSTNKNRIVHLYRSDTNNDGKEDDDLGNRWFIGKPITVAYDFVFDGIYQEGDNLPTNSKPGFVRLKDLNADGKIDAASDRAIIGQLDQPKYRWSLTNTLKYGNFSFSVFLNAMQGWITNFNKLDNSGIESIGGNYPFRSLNMMDNGWWTPENKSNTRPSLTYSNPLGHNYYVSRDFVRIQDVSLAYEAPKPLIKKTGLTNARVFLSGKNLYTFTNYPGADPEIGYTTSPFFPLARTVTLGVNLGF